MKTTTQPEFDLFATDPIEEAFNQFHKQHPAVYRELVKHAREWRSYGHARLGIDVLFCKLRWEWHVRGVEDTDGYKLNNNYRALYARKIMAENADLEGLFEIRTRTASWRETE